MKKPKARVGRPPAGPDGQHVEDYPRIYIRLPDETRQSLLALSALRVRPVYALVDQAVLEMIGRLSDGERADLARLRARRSLAQRTQRSKQQ